MIDIVDARTRSRMMAGIRRHDTRPERLVRSYLHARGFRFRFQHHSLSFRPDLVLSRYQVLIFVHGCFWHRHEGCHYATTPATNTERWMEKFRQNIVRDSRQIEEANKVGWRTLVVWECGLKHAYERIDVVCNLIRSENVCMVWPETPPRPVVKSG